MRKERPREQEEMNLWHWTVSFTSMQGSWNIVRISTLLQIRYQTCNIVKFSKDVTSKWINFTGLNEWLMPLLQNKDKNTLWGLASTIFLLLLMYGFLVQMGVGDWIMDLLILHIYMSVELSSCWLIIYVWLKSKDKKQPNM